MLQALNSSRMHCENSHPHRNICTCSLRYATRMQRRLSHMWGFARFTARDIHDQRVTPTHGDVFLIYTINRAVVRQ